MVGLIISKTYINLSRYFRTTVRRGGRCNTGLQSTLPDSGGLFKPSQAAGSRSSESVIRRSLKLHNNFGSVNRDIGGVFEYVVLFYVIFAKYERITKHIGNKREEIAESP